MTAAAGAAKDPSHEELFLERYTRLLKWASQLTKPDHELAKDLVQESFLQFTLSAGNLLTITNIDNYLFGVVRNAYLTHLRQRSRYLHEPLPDFDFDSTENLLLVVDPRPHIQAKEELRAICRHACMRKESSVTASILILRFFHGYVPSELAQLLHSSRNIVDVQISSARSEAIACLDTQPSTVRPGKTSFFRRPSRKQARLAPDLLTELREEIFATRRGECLNPQQLKKIYHTHKPMPRSTLSHLVSCPRCLDEANKLLGLTPLRERNAIDVLGRASEGPTVKGVYQLIRFCMSFLSGWTLWLFLNSSLADFLSF
jgi:RNA polymerase sigma factor (sigma-70 family)